MSSSVSCIDIRYLFLATAIAAVAVAGCAPTKFPVVGQVVDDDGKAIEGIERGVVEFQSIDVTPSVSPRAGIDAESKFVIGTDSETDGAPPGRYRVIVVPPILVDETKPFQAAAIDAKYRKFETSGLEVVVEKKPNSITLKLTRPKG